MGALSQHMMLMAQSNVAYTTLNPSDCSPNITLSNGNLTATGNTTTSGIVRSIKPIVGKKYFECPIAGPSGGQADTWAVGVATSIASLTGSLGFSDPQGWAFWAAGDGARHNGVTAITHFASAPQVIGVAVDQASGFIWMSVDNVWLSGNPALGTSPIWTGVSGTIYAAACPWTNSAHSVCVMRFNPASFTGTMPSGFSGITA